MTIRMIISRTTAFPNALSATPHSTSVASAPAVAAAGVDSATDAHGGASYEARHSMPAREISTSA